MSIKYLQKLDARIPSWNPECLFKRSCPFCGDDGENRFVRPDGLTVKHCDTCGAFFISPAPNESELSSFYKTYFAEHRRKGIPNPRAVLNARPRDDLRVVEIASHGSLDGKRVLDVGCGWGVLLKRFQKLGASVTGIDLDPQAARFARERLGLPAVRVGTLEQMPAERSFDIICMCDFIEHPLSPMKELEQAISLVAPGGILAVWTPNASFSCNGEDSIPFRVDFEHMQYMTTQTCQWLARRLGLEIVHMESVGFPGLGGIDTLTKPNNGFRLVDYIKNAIRSIPGWHLLKTMCETFYTRKMPDPRSGTYHLFYIFRKAKASE